MMVSNIRECGGSSGTFEVISTCEGLICSRSIEQEKIIKIVCLIESRKIGAEDWVVPEELNLDNLKIQGRKVDSAYK
jgi:hypothetical protein